MKNDAKWNTKLLKPGTRGRVLRVNCLRKTNVTTHRNNRLQILCARVIKALGSRLKSFTLQLTGFVLDCSSSTPWLHFVITDWFAFGQLRFLNSTFTCIVYWQFVSVDKKSHLAECFTDQVKWTMISKVKYFLETFPVFGSYVLTPSIWKWMFITGALYIFPCFLISTIFCDIKVSIQFSHFLFFHCQSVKLCNELVAKIYLMVTACGKRFNIISFVSFTGRWAKLTFGEECLLIYSQVVSCYVRSRT